MGGADVGLTAQWCQDQYSWSYPYGYKVADAALLLWPFSCQLLLFGLSLSRIGSQGLLWLKNKQEEWGRELLNSLKSLVLYPIRCSASLKKKSKTSNL